MKADSKLILRVTKTVDQLDYSKVYLYAHFTHFLRWPELRPCHTPWLLNFPDFCF